MILYLKRLAEFAAVGFLAGAVPAWLQDPGFDRAALHGAVAAGVAALYGAVVKKVGDSNRPTAL